MKNIDKESKKKGSSLFICILILASCYGLYIHIQGWSWENAAQFGDMWGGLNAMFSSLAVAAMASSIFLQRKDLATQREAIDLQRKEMELTRAELAKTADAQEATVAHMNEQAEIMKASALLPEINQELEGLYELLINNRSLRFAKSSTYSDIRSNLSGDFLGKSINKVYDSIDTLIVKYEESKDKKTDLVNVTLDEKIERIENLLTHHRWTVDQLNSIKDLRTERENVFAFLRKT